jgi:uncharacterized protein (DUF362 family)
VETSLENVVAIARTAPSYEPIARAKGSFQNSVEIGLRELFRAWRLDANRYGTTDWNPLSSLIPTGTKVVLKPNWVLHKNLSGASLDCLITHTSVIEAVAMYVGRTAPAALIIGDAPIQGCNFDELRRAAGVDAMAQRLRDKGLPCTISDFRRTILQGDVLGQAKSEGVRDLEQFVLFDLGEDSLLEALNQDATKFRVTMYNPDFLQRTHAAGRHQYLVAREVIDADVVINLPKLKCHKKACVTGVLKNLIGINGNKEYLPHHRKGGSESGGDCYAGSSLWKRMTEDVLDAANRRQPGTVQTSLARIASLSQRVAVRLGADENLEGSWYGNDTIWRTCLDLQRILRYGRRDGSIASSAQRKIISITDAIIAGEGEGPLANTPVPCGFLTGSLSTPAAEWIHARLMGFDPQKIALIREAFGRFKYPLTDFSPLSIRVWTANAEKSPNEILPFEARAFLPPRGWRGHCELDAGDGVRIPESTKPQYVPIDE